MRFLIMCGATIFATGLSAQTDQPSPLDRTVSLAVRRVPLKDALSEVARRAGVRIAYSGRVVPLDRQVSAQLDGVPVRTALDALLDGTSAVPTLDETGQILLVWSGRGHRQTGSISGTVRDAATTTPIAAASVTVVGTRWSGSTDAAGHFAIADVSPGSYRVRARALGYTPGDTTAVVQDGQETVVDVQLKASAIELNPIVAIGYDTLRRRDLTGAVVSVRAEDFKTEAAPTVTLSSGLQGKAAGVQVTSNSGMPGVGLRVHIRGNGSISANGEPLYVIDGVPAEQGSNSSDPKSNPLMSIDPNEIASIDVLKDASATAIYGARGANGVVLITTRRGQAGSSRVTIETSAGFQQISKTIPVLNAQEFMTLTNEARANAGRTLLFTPAQIAAASTYDYPAMMLRTAPQASQAMTLSGGDQKLRYLLSGNYTKQEGIEIGSDFARYGLRLNLDADVSERLRLGTSLSMTHVSRNAARVENGSLGNSANGIQAAMQFAPYAAPVDSAGNWIKTSPSTEPVPNPVANALQETDLNTSSRLLGNVFGEFDITPEVRVRSTLGGSFQFDGIHFFAPRTILDGGTGGSGWIFSGLTRNLTNENTVAFGRDVGPGNLRLLGGFSVQTFYNESVTGNGANFPTDVTTVFNLGSGQQLSPAGSGITESALLSFMGRANYSIADRYLVTFTARRDGSSRFGANNRWAFFPSGAVAWRLSDEPFMRGQSLFDDLKLRLSYGKVGNQAVGPYQSLSQLTVAWYSSAGREIPGLAPSGTMANPDLKWERQTQLNAGVDASMLKNRVTLSLDAYRSVTSDLLMFVTVPATTGYNQQLRNIGSLLNRGVELSLSTINVQRPGGLTWLTTLNLAHNGNRVLDLGTALDSAGNSVPLTEILVTARTGNFLGGETHILRVGEPLSSIYGYRINGLWQAGDACYLRTPAVNCIPGEYKIADLNGDSVITGADRTILGHGDPTLYGGINNTIRYGRFSLDAFLNFTIGNRIINGGNAYGSLAIMQANERRTVLDRWTPTDTNTTIPRANQGRARLLYSTLVESGSYLRLQTLTLGYELPTRWLPRATSARLFVTGQNLFTITGYSGFDPDVNSMGGDSRFGGIDIGAYPRARIWNLGLIATF
jgi:TonB-linked SusC/RagA family outer membrane protein